MKVDEVIQLRSHKYNTERNNNFTMLATQLLTVAGNKTVSSRVILRVGRTFTDDDDLAEMLEGGLTVSSASSFGAFKCILSVYMDLCTSRLLKLLLTEASFAVHNTLSSHNLLVDPAGRPNSESVYGVEYINFKLQPLIPGC